jgi:two-component system, LytTR family, response regulator
MKVLVVDDEPLVRTALGKLLARHAEVEGFDLAQDAQQALDALRAQSYDVMLLDIQMPGMSGLKLVEQLSRQGGPKPAIIFVTAHERYAVEAFEKRALDYILKPFVAARVHEALDMALRRSTQERAESLVKVLEELSARARKSTRIAIKDRDRTVFVDAADLISAEAQGNYVILHESNGSYLHRGTIGGIAEKLEPYGFIRIHRSVLVNAAFVATIRPGVGSDYILQTRNGAEYHVTHTYRHNLKALAQFWIGPESFSHRKLSPQRSGGE